MNSKKCFVLIATLFSFSIGLNTNLWGQEQKDPNDKTKVLQEKIEQLANVIETQQKTITQIKSENTILKQKLDEQTKEAERLKNLCSQAGIDISISLQKDEEPSKDDSKTLTKVSITQLYQLVVTSAQTTTVQREAIYKEREKLYEKMYAGKYVQWKGKIEKVERIGKGYFMSFKYSLPRAPRGFMLVEFVTIQVEFPENESLERRILSLNTGSIVTYEGKLPDSYAEILSLSSEKRLSLTDGKILKYP
jgi:hypothetical protein